MKLTRERKVYGAVLGVGLAVLIVDRTLWAPAGAAASPVPEPPDSQLLVSTGATPVVVTGAPTRASDSELPLAARLRRVDESLSQSPGERRSAFCPASAWLKPESRAQASEIVLPATPSPEEEFRRLHQLTAVMSGPRGGCAKVGSHLVYVGQEYGGFRLVAIDPDQRRATFESNGLRVDLVMPEMLGAGKSRREGADSRTEAPHTPSN